MLPHNKMADKKSRHVSVNNRTPSSEVVKLVLFQESNYWDLFGIYWLHRNSVRFAMCLLAIIKINRLSSSYMRYPATQVKDTEADGLATRTVHKDNKLTIHDVW